MRAAPEAEAEAEQRQAGQAVAEAGALQAVEPRAGLVQAGAQVNYYQPEMLQATALQVAPESCAVCYQDS